MAFDTTVNRIAQMVQQISTRTTYISTQKIRPTSGHSTHSDMTDGTKHYFVVGFDDLSTSASWILG